MSHGRLLDRLLRSLRRSSGKEPALAIFLAVIMVSSMAAPAVALGTDDAAVSGEDTNEAISQSSLNQVTDSDSTDSDGGGTDLTADEVRVTAGDSVLHSSDETVSVWIGAVNTSGETDRPVDGVSVDVTFRHTHEGNQKSETVTTNANGSAIVDFDTTDGPEGRYEVEIESAVGSGSDWFTIGEDTDGVHWSNPAFVGQETTVVIHTNDGGESVSDTTKEVVISNESSDEIVNKSVITNSDGFANVSFTPKDAGRYIVRSDGDYITDVNAGQYIAKVDNDIDPQYSGELVSIGGRVSGPDGRLANANLTIHVAYPNNDTTVDTINADTNEEGFFIAEWDAPAVDDRFVLEAETTAGDTVAFSNRWLSLDERPSEDEDTVEESDDISIDLFVDQGSDTDFVEPGGNTTVDIHVENTSSRQAVSNETVEIVGYYDDYPAVPYTSLTVETDANGDASKTLDIPSEAPEDVDLEVVAAITVDGETYSVDDDQYIEIKQYELDADPWEVDLDPGSTVEIPIEAYDSAYDPVSDISAAYSAQYHDEFSVFETGSVTTNETGEASIDLSIPEDAEEEIFINDIHRYSPTNYFFSPDINHPTIEFFDVPDTVKAGEEIEVGYNTSAGESVALGWIGTDGEVRHAIGSESNQDGTLTISVPENASEGTDYDLKARAYDTNGTLHTGESYEVIEVVDSPVDAAFTYDPQNPEPNETITFDAGDSTSDSAIEDYSWEFGDGDVNGSAEPTVDHTFEEPGEYQVNLTVWDNDGYSDSVSQTVVVEEQQTVSGQLTLSNGSPASGDLVAIFDGDQLINTETDGDGNFSLDTPVVDDPPEGYGIQYYQASFEDGVPVGFEQDGKVDVHAVSAINTSDDIDIGTETLPVGHNVNVSVVDEDGHPVENATVQILDTNAEDGSTAGTSPVRTDSNGQLVFGEKPGVELNGSVKISVTPPEDNEVFVDQTYVEERDISEPEDIEFVLPDRYDEDNISVWERSPLPLRVDTSNAATRVETPNPKVRIEGEGEDTLNKPEVGVFNTGDEIGFEFKERDTALTSDRYEEGTQTQFVTARVEEIPDSLEETIDIATLQSTEAEAYSVEDAGEIDGAGAVSNTTTIDKPGNYLTYLVTVEEGDGFSEVSGDKLVLDGSVEVAGIDAVAVQSAEADIDAPNEVQRSQTLSVDVSSNLDSETTNHFLVAYKEETFVNQDLKVIVDTEDFTNITEDNVTIKHSIEEVNGVAELDATVSVLGLSAGSGVSVDGTTPLGSVLDRIANESNIDRVDNETVDSDVTVLDISANATQEFDDGTITVETLPTWKTGEYRLVYIAQEDGDVSTFSTDTDTVNVFDEELSAAVTADPSAPDVNVTEVVFDASNTAGSVTEYQWDFDGDGDIDETTEDPTVTHVYNVSELGEYEATVTAVGPEGDTSPASVTITVDDTVDPEAALDLTYEGESIVDGSLGLGERFTANASESTDNHRIDSYNWSVMDDDGNEVASDESLDPTTSFRISEAGSYTIAVTAIDESGNENTTTASFEIGPRLTASIDADGEQRLQDGLNVSRTIENDGGNDTQKDIDWTFTASATTIDGDSVELTDGGTITGGLEANEEDELISIDDKLTEWAQENQTVGDVTLQLTIETADDAVTTRNDTSTVDVTYTDLETDVFARDTVQGVETSFRTFVTNNGTAESDESEASVTVTKDGPEEFANTTTVSELEPDETQRNRFTESFDTDGTYTLTVDADDELFPRGNETSTTFEVHPYTLNVDGVDAPDEVESGDQFIIAVEYTANASAPVNASLNVSETDGVSVQDGQSELIERTPEAGSPDTLVWQLQADEFDEDGYDLNVTIEDTLEHVDETDSTQISINSSRRTEVRTEEASAVMNDSTNSASTNVTVYGNSSSVSHSLNLSVQGGSEGRTLQGLEYLVHYPYGCVEQTTSAFLGALNTDQYYRDRDYSIDDTRQDRINGSIERGVARLNQTDKGLDNAWNNRAQQDDGSWNMWGREGAPGDTFYSIYALYGLSEVANDETYGDLNSEGLADVDFDKAVTWLKGDQNEDGSFDASYYISDQAGSTGFAMISLAQTNASENVTTETRENITEIYANGSEYLIEEQHSDGSWNDDNAKSTALAVWGLQNALDAGAYEESTLDEQEMENAIDEGVDWLVDNQQDDGSWEPYHDNYWWISTGDRSETTAYAVLALNETGVAPTNETVEAGADKLIGTYESRGSWGYTRATAISIEALTQVTAEGSTDRTVTVTFTNGSDSVTIDGLELNESSVDLQESLTDSERDQVRALVEANEDNTITVEMEATDGNGIVILGVENTQEVDLDELEGDT